MDIRASGRGAVRGDGAWGPGYFEKSATPPNSPLLEARISIGGCLPRPARFFHTVIGKSTDGDDGTPLLLFGKSMDGDDGT